MCYKDKTFCNSNCVNTECNRNFSPEQRAGAIKWWGNDTAPVAFSASYRDGCEDYKAPMKLTEENNNAIT